MLPNGEETTIGEKGINLSGVFPYLHYICFTDICIIGGQKVLNNELCQYF